MDQAQPTSRDTAMLDSSSTRKWFNKIPKTRQVARPCIAEWSATATSSSILPQKRSSKAPSPNRYGSMRLTATGNSHPFYSLQQLAAVRHRFGHIANVKLPPTLDHCWIDAFRHRLCQEPVPGKTLREGDGLHPVLSDEIQQEQYFRREHLPLSRKRGGEAPPQISAVRVADSKRASYGQQHTKPDFH